MISGTAFRRQIGKAQTNRSPRSKLELLAGHPRRSSGVPSAVLRPDARFYTLKKSVPPREAPALAQLLKRRRRRPQSLNTRPRQSLTIPEQLGVHRGRNSTKRARLSLNYDRPARRSWLAPISIETRVPLLTCLAELQRIPVGETDAAVRGSLADGFRVGRAGFRSL